MCGHYCIGLQWGNYEFTSSLYLVLYIIFMIIKLLLLGSVKCRKLIIACRTVFRDFSLACRISHCVIVGGRADTSGWEKSLWVEEEEERGVCAGQSAQYPLYHSYSCHVAVVFYQWGKLYERVTQSYVVEIGCGTVIQGVVPK